jgi:endonuclease I
VGGAFGYYFSNIMLAHIVGLNFVLFVLVRSQDTSDAVFFDCSIEDYYENINTETGNLEPASWDPTDISDLLRDTHRQGLPYTSSSREDVWDALIDLDSTQDGESIPLIYKSVEVPASEYGTSENWNREHLWPKSRGVGNSGKDYTDVHALRPSDWNVNSARSNLFFGDCGDLCTSRPAHSEAAADTGRDGNVFLPPAQVRGDIARALFYMAMRYASFDESNTEVLELTDCPDESVSYQMAYLSDLLRWHEEDPPDDTERIRNGRVCSRWQGNRNVFVDFPELAAHIFGTPAEKPYDCDVVTSSAPTPSPTTTMNNQSPPTDVAVGSCGQLSSGDVQVVSLSSDNPDSVVLVALKDLPRGMELFMTDNAWMGSEFKTNEGTLKV